MSKFEDIELKPLLIKFPVEVIDTIDCVAAHRKLRTGRPCPRLDVLREALEMGLQKVVAEDEQLHRSDARRVADVEGRSA